MARIETSNVGIRNFRNVEFLNLKAATFDSEIMTLEKLDITV